MFKIKIDSEGWLIIDDGTDTVVLTPYQIGIITAVLTDYVRGDIKKPIERIFLTL